MAYSDALRQQYATFTTAADLIDGLLTDRQTATFGDVSIKDTATGAVTIDTYSNDTGRSALIFRKSRNAAIDGNTLVNTGDTLGEIFWQGANGTGYTNGARIRAVVSGVPGATNDMPTTMLFDTTPEGSGTLTERMRISPDGLVGIGMSALSAQLAVQAKLNTSSSVQTYSVTGDVAQAAIEIIKFDNNSTTTQNFIHFWINNGAAQSGKITANGANQATFTSTSDERLKENIVDLPPQLNNILTLRPVEFDYKDGSGHQTGFIAQEVQQVYPDLVSQNDTGYLDLAGLGKFEARLIKALQELTARIEALEQA